MWWTHWWVEKIFSDDAKDLDIRAAVRHSSYMAFGLAICGGVQWIIGFILLGSGEEKLSSVGIFLGLIGSAALLGAIIMERIELLMFALLWDKRRHEKEELRRLDAADL